MKILRWTAILIVFANILIAMIGIYISISLNDWGAGGWYFSALCGWVVALLCIGGRKE